MEDERVAQLRRAYDAFNRRAIDEALAAMDPDVDWPGLDDTRVQGRDAVREYWSRQFEQIDAHVEPTAFIPHKDSVTVAVHQVVRDRGGRVLSDSHIAHTYTFRGTRALTMTVYPSVPDAVTAH